MFQISVQYRNEDNIWESITDFARPVINKETLDETHDETQLYLPCSDISTPFRPFTRFVINIEELDDEGNIVNTETFYRVVVIDEFNQIKFSAPKKYRHNIRLAEASKELERYTVDNLSFTNVWDRSYGQGSASVSVRTLDTSYNQIVYALNERMFFRNYSMVSSSGLSDPYTWVNYLFMYDANYQGNTYDCLINIADSYNYGSIRNRQSGVVIKNAYYADSLLARNAMSQDIINQITPPTIGNPVTSSTISFTVGTSFNLTNLVFPTALPQAYKFGGTYGDLSNIAIQQKLVLTNVVQTLPNGTNRPLGTSGTYADLDVSARGRHTFTYTYSYMIKATFNLHISGTGITPTDYNGVETGWITAGRQMFSQSFLSADAGQAQLDSLNIYGVLSRLVQVTPTRFSDNNTPKFQISAEVLDKYGMIEAPEFIFTNKNLWEVLREIGGVINAIPYLEITGLSDWNVINYFPLGSEEKEAQTVSQSYVASDSMYDAENYTACYDTPVENMINSLRSNEGRIISPGSTLSKTVRSETVEINEATMEIETQYPVYKIGDQKGLEYVYYSNGTAQYLDLSLFVKEFSEYQTLSSSDQNNGKALAVYYTQGQKNIKGLQYKVEKNVYADSYNVISIKKIIAAMLGVTETDVTDIYKGKFIVRYIPYINARIRTYKTNAPRLKIDTSMFQNQSSNVLDSRALGRKMVSNINRTGNLTYRDSHKVLHLNQIPKKGQRSADGYFVGTIETEYDRYRLLSTISYTKDYQLISQYVNIYNQQRYYEISEKQSIDRYVNTNMFYVFGDNIDSTLRKDASKRIKAPNDIEYLEDIMYDHGSAQKLNGSVITSYALDQGTGELITNPVSKVYANTLGLATGNSISIITDFKDNYSAGSQAIPYNTAGTDALVNREVPYSDAYGNIYKSRIQNVSDIGITAPTESIMQLFAQRIPDISTFDVNISDTAGTSSQINFRPVGCDQEILVSKDNRECLHFNQQHHFLVNDDRVVIGSGMTERCRFIQDNTFTTKIVWLKNPIDRYEYKIKDEDIISSVSITSSNAVGTESSGTPQDKYLIITASKMYLRNYNSTNTISGMTEEAKAWALVVDTEGSGDNIKTNVNELIVGKNIEFKNGDTYDSIYVSATSDYTV